MKYLGGYITAAILGAITWVLMQFGERFTNLVDMVYPYVIRTLQSFLAQWSSGVDFLIWQLLAIVLVAFRCPACGAGFFKSALFIAKCPTCGFEFSDFELFKKVENPQWSNRNDSSERLNKHD